MNSILLLVVGLVAGLGCVLRAINRGCEGAWLLALRDFLGGLLLVAILYALYIVS